MSRRMVIVPNEVSAAITAEVDRFLALHPEAEGERANMEADLLVAFDQHGVVAKLAPKEATNDEA